MWTTLLYFVQEAALHITPVERLLISETIHVRHTKHCWRSKDKSISHILLWTTTDRHTSFSWRAKTYFHHFYMDTWCHLKDLSRVISDRDKWRWWWWYLKFLINNNFTRALAWREVQSLVVVGTLPISP